MAAISAALILVGTAAAPAAAAHDSDGLLAPVVSGATATAIGPTGATIQAQIALGVTVAGSAFVEYGHPASYGMTTAPLPLGLVAFGQPLSIALSGLAPGVKYHARVVATNALGATGRSPDVSFKTLTTGPDPVGPSPTATPSPTPTPKPTPAKPTPGKPNSTKPSPDTTATTPSAGTAAPAAPGPVPGTDATPSAGSTVVVGTASGSVRVQAPGGDWTELRAGVAVPVGSILDATRGTVVLTSAVDAHGRVQSGQFRGGAFRVRQTRGAAPITELQLTGHPVCGTKATAAAARKRPRLWGRDHHGRFRTRGRDSVATVRGTRWYTEDTCAGTVTRVSEGAVDVRDLHAHRTVRVRAGHRYLARRR